MPASYTHFSFGEDVYNRLPEELRKVIDISKEAYYIGLNGPDILFYYKPLTKNPVKTYGHQLHEDIALKLFKRAKKHIRDYEDNISMSYILGFVCHFILDSRCHPYIEAAVKKSGLSHGLIEAELDGAMMRRNNLDPQRHNAGNHIIPNKEIADHICNVYENISGQQVYKCLKAVRFYNSLLTCENKFKRTFIKQVLKSIKGGDSFSEMIINVIPEPKGRDIIKDLNNIYEKAQEQAVQMISTYYGEIIENTEVNQMFSRNFL